MTQLHQKFDQQNGAAKAARIVIIAVSTALTYQGLVTNLEPSLVSKVLASCLAAGTFCCLYLYNDFVISVLTSNEPLRNRLAVLFLALLFSIFIAMLSTATSVAGLAGNDAQLVHLKKFEQSLSADKTLIYQHAKSVRLFLPIFKNTSQAWQQASVDERQSGAYSGFPGSHGGAVSTTLKNYASDFDNLYKQAEEFLKEVEILNEKADQELLLIRQIIEKSDTPAQATKDITEPVDRLKALMIAMNGQDLIGGFNVAVANLPNALKAITLSRNASIAQGQQAAIDKIAARLTDDSNLLTAEFKRYQNTHVPVVSVLAPMNGLSAVLRYWHLYLQAFAASFALDFLPLFIAVTQMILHMGKSEARRINEERMNMSVGSYMQFLIAQKQLGYVTKNTEALTQANKKYLGLEDGKQEEQDDA